MSDSSRDKEIKTNSNFGDGITLKEIILKIRYWFAILWPIKTLIISVSLTVGLSFSLYTKFLSLPTYTASYELFFEKDAVGGLSSAMRLASSFGISLGGGSSTSIKTVQAFLTSRDNLSAAMLTELDNDLLINRYFAKKIKDDQEFATEFELKFLKNRRFTDSIYSEIAFELNEEGLLGALLNEETGMVTFFVNGKDESFVFDLARLLIHNAQEVFIGFNKQRSIAAVNAFQSKVDSIKLALDETLIRLGEYEDQNNSLVSSVDKMRRMRLTIDLEALKISFGEYLKGLEMSKVELMNQDPPFKYFDTPTYPLKKEKRSAALVGIFGSLISALLFTLFYILRDEFKNIISD